MGIFQMKEFLSNREYLLFQKYFIIFGIGQEAEYRRSANLISTISNYISGAMGGKPPNNTPEDIYPQLSYEDTSKKTAKGANQLIDWDKTPEHIKTQLIGTGLYTEDGTPLGYNPHGGTASNDK